MGYLSKTNLRPGMRLQGTSAHLETQLRTPQLLILICLSTTVGVSLAAGLVNLLQMLLPGMMKGRVHVKKTGECLHLGSSGV